VAALWNKFHWVPVFNLLSGLGLTWLAATPRAAAKIWDYQRFINRSGLQ
jgi:hypothetical protein